MKTFLHFTKELELVEGLGDTAEKIGKGISSIRNNPFMSLLGKGAGGKELGDAFVGFAEKKKKQREEQMQDRRDFVAAKVRQLGRNNSKVKDFYRLEANILDPSKPKSREERQKELDDHYTNYTW